MAGVASIRSEDEAERVPPARAEMKDLLAAIPDDDTEAVKELQDLVDGKIPFDLSMGGEFVEGKATDCSNLLLSELRNAKISVQDRIDLHGFTREQAKEELHRFFKEAVKNSKRCVLVISGRGLRSPGGKPVIKELLVKWLISSVLSRYVLAFSSAKGYDGGTGAMYVLLRKQVRVDAFSAN